MSKDSPPRVPFIWPAVLASGGGIPNATIPFEEVARSASSLFGVISAMDARAVEWLEGYLADTEAAQVRIVLSIHPVCRTATADLHELLRLVERHGSRAALAAALDGATSGISMVLVRCSCQHNVLNDTDRVVIDAMERDMGTHLATNTEIDGQRLAWKYSVDSLRREMEFGFAMLRMERKLEFALLSKDMAAQTSRIIIQLGSLIIASTALILAAVLLR